MKHKIYVLVSALLLSGVSITAFAQAQQNNDTTANPEKRQEEIVIREKGIPQKDLDIHIKGDEVWVNGKKLENGADSNMMVLRRQVPVFDDDNNNKYAFSMGPHQGMEFFQGPNNNFMLNNNKALLGVVTEKADSIHGAKIADISDGTGAAKSDLQVGDIITKVNDDVINNPQDLVTAIGKYQPGDEVNITYQRNGNTHETKVRLGKRDMMGMLNIAPNMDNWQRQFRMMPMPMGPGNAYGFSYHYPGEDEGKPALGLSIQDTENGNGVKVLEVEPSSPAAIAGVKKDDIIKQFNSKDIHSVDEMAKMLHANKSNDNIQLKILRDGKTKDITVKLPKHLRTMNL